jgi:hypothetical protein
MATKTVQLDSITVEVSQPLADRPGVVLIVADDGRRSVLGDGRDPFTPTERRQFETASPQEAA